jgi:hypothetical protein
MEWHMQRIAAGARDLCVMGLLAAVVPAGSPGGLAAEDPMAAAERAAGASAATPEGKKFEDDVATAFGRDQGKGIQACAKETKRPDLSDFHLFIQVSGAGQVEQAFVKPSTNLAACVQSKVKGWQAGVPPKGDAWVSVHVKLQRK